MIMIMMMMRKMRFIPSPTGVCPRAPIIEIGIKECGTGRERMSKRGKRGPSPAVEAEAEQTDGTESRARARILKIQSAAQRSAADGLSRVLSTHALSVRNTDIALAEGRKQHATRQWAAHWRPTAVAVN
jgi:hypothetical protein